MTDTVLFVKGQTFLVKFAATPKRGRILSPFYIPSVVICNGAFIQLPIVDTPDIDLCHFFDIFFIVHMN